MWCDCYRKSSINLSASHVFRLLLHSIRLTQFVVDFHHLHQVHGLDANKRAKHDDEAENTADEKLNSKDSAGKSSSIVDDTKDGKLKEVNTEDDALEEREDKPKSDSDEPAAPDDSLEGSSPDFEAMQANFPERLMKLLQDETLGDSMKWLPNGDGFSLNPKDFQAVVLDKHFFGTKYESFTRKLNRW